MPSAVLTSVPEFLVEEVCMLWWGGGLVLVHGSWIIALTDKPLGFGVCRN